MGLIIALMLVSLLTFSHQASSSPAAPASFRVNLTHVDNARGYSRTELVKRAAERSKVRAAKLAGNLGPVSVHPSNGEYVLDLAIGTPPLYFTGILDTGSDLIWTQCKTCMRCIPQPSPLFDPLRSPSFSPLPCSHKLCRALALDKNSACAPNCLYHYHYGDNTDTIGFMGTETFTFGTTNKVHIPSLAFGCGVYNAGDIQNSSGIIGFGRGPISLVSQLGATAFSYCFTDNFADDSATSPLFFGTMARLAGPNVRTTPLIPVAASSTFYYLSLKGITVGDSLLPIPPKVFERKKDGNGGTIIDSGTAFLMLDTPVYKPFVGAFRSQVKARAINTTGVDTQLELCYNLSSAAPVEVPRLVFHFQDADWEMPERNYFLVDGEMTCLVAMESPGMSILGNVQTQNMHVSYDLKKDKLSFMPARCNRI